jgi:hypothetical protein
VNIAVVDSSCVVAIVFGVRAGVAMQKRLEDFDRLFAAPLLEAELLCALRRESLSDLDVDLSAFQWILPSRPLSDEVRRVLAAGYVRGADCWHLASALFLSPEPSEATFLTLDPAPRKAARTLGFET